MVNCKECQEEYAKQNFEYVLYEFPRLFRQPSINDNASTANRDALLQFLFQHSTAPELIYRHNWRQGDLMIWDNRCIAHYAVADYKAVGDRYMHRISVKGDWPA